MLRAPLRILIVAALCVAGLTGLVVRESMARDAGTEVLLAMEAVDPRSLLSGHYVIVDLRETLAPDMLCPEQTEAVEWVALEPKDGHHALAGAGADRAEAARLGPVVARGTFDCFQPTRMEGEAATPGWIALHLGVERFHVSQAEAERIEDVLRDQAIGDETRVYAIASIGRDGRARLKGLMVDGERIELGWL